MSPPRPLPSPQPPQPYEDEPKTDPGLRAALQRHDNKLTLRSFVIAAGAVATAVASVLTFIDSRVAHATDAGYRVLESRTTASEQHVKDIRGELVDFKAEQRAANARTDAKLDAALSAMRVRNPAPAPDGGQ